MTINAEVRTATFAENQVVRDDEGNHFRVVSARGTGVRCESVATKELFLIPAEELTLTDLSPR